MNTGSLNNKRWALAMVLIAGLSGCGGVQSATRKDSLSADEHVRLGLSYEERGLRSSAAKEYGAALRRDVKHLPALMALGNLEFQKGDLIEAEIYYRRVLRIVSDHAGANNNLAMVYLVRGSRLDTAESLAKAALKQAGPFRPYVLDTLANVYMRQGRYPLAKRALDEAEAICGADNTMLREHLVQSRRQLMTFSQTP